MDKNSQKVMVRFCNASGTAWQFPDGAIIHNAYEAQRKADKLGMILEKRNLRAYSHRDRSVIRMTIDHDFA
ncbi:hypothetical protein AAH678_14785 [Sodalis endosymbiont of Spalangia cameroni]|uniref:hypothetical protein n=1 Tax=Sodalis praecaptivus TaxID=1239307 RepID=UPI0031F79AC1